MALFSPTGTRRNRYNIPDNLLFTDFQLSVLAGSEDIVHGSLKLILGLVWHLILRYQIGKTKFPPKKLMLAWLKAVIPDLHISNFTSDWNDGVALRWATLKNESRS